MDRYDLLVIGAGPGGYVAAIRGAQLGLRVACVDKWVGADGKPALGGTCLNVGCIPSKALLESSHRYAALADLSDHGIQVDGARFDLAAMQARKTHVVRALTGGIAGLFQRHKIAWLKGSATLAGDGQVDITGPEGTTRAAATHIVLATGSVPSALPVAPLDPPYVVDSTGALAFDAVPARLAVIGAGAIGLELGSVWARLGAQVTVLEALDDFLPALDRAVAREALKVLRAQGLDIRLGAAVGGVTRRGEAVQIDYRQGDAPHTLDADRLIVAAGRRAYTDGLGLDAAGVRCDARGRIEVDARFCTSVPGVYAIGDAIAGPMLAHKASEDGIAVAEGIAGQAVHVDYAHVPAVIYTHPEIAWVGLSEAAAQAAGTPVRAGAFPLAASGRARASGEATGTVRVIAHAENDRVLGVHILAPNASELIAEAVLALEYHASSEDIARTVHAHPTLAEALHEAALAVDGRAIHVG
jgi:dihydrolipoamide dehydrogenase